MSIETFLRLKAAAKQILDKAEGEGRALTPDERGQFKALHAQALAEKDRIEFGRAIADLGGGTPIVEGGPRGGSLSAALKSAGFDPGRGQFKATVPDMKAALGEAPATASPYLHPRLPQADPDESGLGFSDWTIGGSGAIGSGDDIERDPTGSTSKAVLDRTVTWVPGTMGQVALLVQDIPSAILAASGFQSFIDSEMRFRLDRAIDAMVVEAIVAASPPSGASGDDLIAWIRNGAAAMFDVGSKPDILVVDSSTAAELDLTKSVGGSEEYLFPPRASGSADPLFSLSVVTVAAATDPILIDSARLGAVRIGAGSFMADPFTGFAQNLVDLRAEVLASFHVRNSEGAYRIVAGS
jgi:hypothetical protein